MTIPLRGCPFVVDNGIVMSKDEFVNIQSVETHRSIVFEILDLSDLEDIIKVLVEYIISQRGVRSKAINRSKGAKPRCFYKALQPVDFESPSNLLWRDWRPP